LTSFKSMVVTPHVEAMSLGVIGLNLCFSLMPCNRQSCSMIIG